MSLKTKSHHYTKGLPNNALPGFTALFSRCLKILGKVVFSIASEVSYVYILSEQKIH